jgi:hypothetical protein
MRAGSDRSRLQPLHHIGGAAEQHTPATFDQRIADGRRGMTLAGARRAETQDVGALFDPVIGFGERQQVRLAHRRHGCEVEAGEGLAGRQAGFPQVPGDAPLGALGQFVLAECGKIAGSTPAFGIGALGEALPVPADGRQVQCRQHQRQARRIDAGHPASPDGIRANRRS